MKICLCLIECLCIKHLLDYVCILLAGKISLQADNGEAPKYGRAMTREVGYRLPRGRYNCYLCIGRVVQHTRYSIISAHIHMYVL